MSARLGAAATARAPLLLQFPPPPRPPAPPSPLRQLLRFLPCCRGAAAAAGAAPGAGPAGGPRTRHLVQLLALLLAASGYGLLMASSALAPAQPAPQPPPPPSVAPAQHRLASLSRPAHAQAVLPRPAAAAEEEDGGEADGAVDVQALEAELEERRRRVWKVCAERGLQRGGQPNAWEFFIDSRHNLVWCNIFKAASTAWLYNFNLLAGYSESFLRRSLKPPLVLARARYPRPTPQQLSAALPDSLSFLIVREPFERLLSAYRNKLEGLRNRFYRKLGREISSRQPRRANDRPNASPQPPPAPPPPRHPNAVDPGDAPDPRLPGPTFQQFVDHVIATGLRAHKPKFDEHWAPYHSFCTPCHVNFTVIAKVETLSRDEEYIIERAGLESVLLAASRRRERPRKVTNRARGTKATADLVARYYATLTRDQLKDLYRIYGTDFELFGYNVSKYFDLARPDG